MHVSYAISFFGHPGSFVFVSSQRGTPTDANSGSDIYGNDNDQMVFVTSLEPDSDGYNQCHVSDPGLSGRKKGGDCGAL